MRPADDSLQDRPAVVTGATWTALADAVEEGLRDAGARVERLDPDGPNADDLLEQAGPFEMVVQVVTDRPVVEPGTQTLLDALADADQDGSLLFVCPLDDSGQRSIERLVRKLAVELGPRGVRVNAVTTADGPTGAPLSRPLTSGDVVGIARVLLSDTTAGCVTGAIVPVDRGVQAQQALASAATGHAGNELDVDLAVAWVKRLLEDAEGSNRRTAAGMSVRELADGLASRDPDFDPVAAGFPTRLIFVRYALAGTDYAIQGDDERTAQVVSVTTLPSGYP